MKQSPKIALCILMLFSVITMVACTPLDTPENTKPQVQDKNNTQPSVQPEKTEPISLDFNVKSIQAAPDSSITYPQIQLLTLTETATVIDDLKALQNQYGNEAPTLGVGAEELSYDEAYFENKSLVLIRATIPMDGTLTVSQVNYDGKALKVTLEYPEVAEGTLSLSAFGYWCMFVEINAKLPDTTTVSVETVIADS